MRTIAFAHLASSKIFWNASRVHSPYSFAASLPRGLAARHRAWSRNGARMGGYCCDFSFPQCAHRARNLKRGSQSPQAALEFAGDRRVDGEPDIARACLPPASAGSPEGERSPNSGPNCTRTCFVAKTAGKTGDAPLFDRSMRRDRGVEDDLGLLRVGRLGNTVGRAI